MPRASKKPRLDANEELHVLQEAAREGICCHLTTPNFCRNDPMFRVKVLALYPKLQRGCETDALAGKAPASWSTDEDLNAGSRGSRDKLPSMPEPGIRLSAKRG